MLFDHNHRDDQYDNHDDHYNDYDDQMIVHRWLFQLYDYCNDHKNPRYNDHEYVHYDHNPHHHCPHQGSGCSGGCYYCVMGGSNQEGPVSAITGGYHGCYDLQGVK